MQSHFKPPLSTLLPLLPTPLSCCCVSTIRFMERHHPEGTFSLPAPNLPSHYLRTYPVLLFSYSECPTPVPPSGTSTWVGSQETVGAQVWRRKVRLQIKT